MLAPQIEQVGQQKNEFFLVLPPCLNSHLQRDMLIFAGRNTTYLDFKIKIFALNEQPLKIYCHELSDCQVALW